MKNVLLFLLIVSMFTSCSYNSMSGSPAAVSAGASIGGVLGSIIGDRSDGYNGSQFGALIGTVAGAAIGNALTTPSKKERKEYSDDYGYNDNGGYMAAASNLRIQNIRFIDDNRNHVIEPNESAKLVFDIVNVGEAPAYNIIPVAEELDGNKHLKFSQFRQISYMPKGNKIRYTMTVYADKRIKNGTARFCLYATESNGAVSEPHEFSLPIRR